MDGPSLGKTYYYSAQDYLFGYQLYPGGFYFWDDDLTLEGAKELLTHRFPQARLERDSSFMLSEFPAREWDFLLAGNLNPAIGSGTYCGGNRIYFLFAPLSEKVSQTEEFLNTFQFLPYAQSAWQTYTHEKGYFTLQFPEGEIRTEPLTDRSEDPTETYLPLTNLNGGATYTALDSATGTSYVWSHTVYSEYAQIAHKDSLFEEIIQHYTQMDETQGQVVSLRNISYQGHPGKTCIIQTPQKHTVLRLQLVLAGNHLFVGLAALAPDQMESREQQSFFQGLQVSDSLPYVDLLADKTQKILLDLRSPELERRLLAKSTLKHYSFSPADSIDIMEAARKLYGDEGLGSYATLAILHDHLACSAGKDPGISDPGLVSSIGFLSPSKGRTPGRSGFTGPL